MPYSILMLLSPFLQLMSVHQTAVTLPTLVRDAHIETTSRKWSSHWQRLPQKQLSRRDQDLSQNILVRCQTWRWSRRSAGTSNPLVQKQPTLTVASMTAARGSKNRTLRATCSTNRTGTASNKSLSCSRSFNAEMPTWPIFPFSTILHILTKKLTQTLKVYPSINL